MMKNHSNLLIHLPIHEVRARHVFDSRSDDTALVDNRVLKQQAHAGLRRDGDFGFGGKSCVPALESFIEVYEE